METALISLFKVIAILLTAVSGVYGTVFDYKKDGKLTPHGKTAIAGLVVFGLLSLAIQLVESRETYKNTVKATEDLKDNIARQTKLLSNSERASKQLSDLLARADKTAQNLRDLSVVADKTIRLLNVPLESIFCSFSVLLDGADKRFPNYFKRLTSKYGPEGRRVITIDSADFPKRSEASAYNYLKRTPYNLSIGAQVPHSGMLRKANESHLSYTVFPYPGPIDELTLPARRQPTSCVLVADIGAKTIEIASRFAATEKQFDDDTILSVFDILEPVDKFKMYVAFDLTIQQGFSDPVLKYLTLHFDAVGRNQLLIPGDRLEKVIPRPSFGVDVVLYYCTIDDIQSDLASRLKKAH